MDRPAAEATAAPARSLPVSVTAATRGSLDDRGVDLGQLLVGDDERA